MITREEWLELREKEIKLMMDTMCAAVKVALQPLTEPEIAPTEQELAAQQAAKVADHRKAMRRMFACAALHAMNITPESDLAALSARAWEIADAMVEAAA